MTYRFRDVLCSFTHLLPCLLLFSLGLHLLHFNGVDLPPSHEKIVVTDAQLQDLETEEYLHS